VIAAGLAMVTAREDAIVFDEDSAHSWIRACPTETFLRLGQRGSHEFLVCVVLGHEQKV
jgi:hypothetical protein